MSFTSVRAPLLIEECAIHANDLAYFIDKWQAHGRTECLESASPAKHSPNILVEDQKTLAFFDFVFSGSFAKAGVCKGTTEPLSRAYTH